MAQVSVYHIDLTTSNHHALGIRNGNSGSWVVDASSHEVYGYLVASDVFRDGYVIPLDATLRDMKTELSAESICLPTRDEVHSWHISRWLGEESHFLFPSPTPLPLSPLSFDFDDTTATNFEDTPVADYFDGNPESNISFPRDVFEANVAGESDWLHPKNSENSGGPEQINDGRSVNVIEPLPAHSRPFGRGNSVSYGPPATTSKIIENSLVPPPTHHHFDEVSPSQQRTRFRSARRFVKHLFGHRLENDEVSNAITTREGHLHSTLFKRQDSPSPQSHDSGYSSMEPSPIGSAANSRSLPRCY